MTIDFKSFVKKGFCKNDNDFGLYCYTGKQGKGKTYTSINFLINYIVNNPDTQIVTNIHSFKTFKIYCHMIRYYIIKETSHQHNNTDNLLRNQTY